MHLDEPPCLQVKRDGHVGQILTAFLLCSDASVEKEEVTEN